MDVYRKPSKFNVHKTVISEKQYSIITKSKSNERFDLISITAGADGHLEVLWLVGQLLGLTAGSSPPLLQSTMSVVGWRRALGYLGRWGLVARGALISNDDHGVAIVGPLVLCLLQHDHALRVLLPQRVQRNHCSHRDVDGTQSVR